VGESKFSRWASFDTDEPPSQANIGQASVDDV